MKNTLLLCLLLTASSFLFSQDNPYEKYGFKPKVATMTNGKFIEIHDRDTIVQIGRIVYNTMSKEIVGFVEYDTAYSEATLAPDVVSRWLSPDPLQHMRLWVSPYNFVQNNPIMRIDPDGRLDGDYYDKEGNWLYNDGIDDDKVYEVSMASSLSSEIPGSGEQTISYLGQVQDVFTTGDQISDERIQNLHPAIRMKATNFINDVNETSGNTLIRVAQGNRTFAEQNALYAQGRTTEGPIVTNAKGGFSNHNFGLAFDIVGITDNKIDYNLDWDNISISGKSHGFDWGGDWTSFKDQPHFENMFGNSVPQLREKFNSGDATNGYVNVK